MYFECIQCDLFKGRQSFLKFNLFLDCHSVNDICIRKYFILEWPYSFMAELISLSLLIVGSNISCLPWQIKSVAGGLWTKCLGTLGRFICVSFKLECFPPCLSVFHQGSYILVSKKTLWFSCEADFIAGMSVYPVITGNPGETPRVVHVCCCNMFRVWSFSDACVCV